MKYQALVLRGKVKGLVWLHVPSAAIIVECGSTVVWDSGLHATTSIAVGISVAVRSGGGTVGHREKEMVVSAITSTTWIRR